ncbi:NUDIX domain-containing protein [Lysinibacillus fusiformis]|nr:NUDIX domain-containing protein [Lysinibacillus fusiformis]
MFPRAKALGIISKGDAILLEEKQGKHSKGEGLFYRPIGGTIELGERSDETLIREFQEELGCEIAIKSYLSCLENIFKIEGKIGHELVQVYLVEFKDKSLYQKEVFDVMEGEKITLARWISKEDIFEGRKVLYPDGLAKLIKQEPCF